MSSRTKNTLVRLRVTRPLEAAHKARLHKGFVAAVGTGLQLGDFDPDKGPRSANIKGNIWQKDIWIAPGTHVQFKWFVINGVTNKVMDSEETPLREVAVGKVPILVSTIYNKTNMLVSEISSVPEASRSKSTYVHSNTYRNAKYRKRPAKHRATKTNRPSITQPPNGRPIQTSEVSRSDDTTNYTASEFKAAVKSMDTADSWITRSFVAGACMFGMIPKYLFCQK